MRHALFEAARRLPSALRIQSVQLSLVAALQIATSFAVQWYVVMCFGAGRETDALYTGATIPLLVNGVFVQSFKSVLIPILTPEDELEQRTQVWLMAVLSVLVFGAATAVLYGLAPYLVPVLAPGFEPATMELAIGLSRIQLFGIVGGAVSAIFLVEHYLKGRFLLVPLTTLACTVIGLAVLLWKLSDSTIQLAAWVQAAIATGPAFVLAALAGRPGFPRWKPAMWRTIWERTRPLLAVRTYALINTPIDRWLASLLPAGSIVIFELVGRFYGAVVRILTQGILTPYFPRLSSYASKGDWADYDRLLGRQSRLIVAAGSASAAGVAVFAVAARVWAGAAGQAELIGSITGEQIVTLVTVILLLAAYIPLSGLGEAQVNGFYAVGDTKTPTKLAAWILTLSIVLKVVGMLTAGIEGMALAAMLAPAIFVAVMHRKLKAASLQRRAERQMSHA